MAPSSQPTAATFRFVSDGPRGPGWTRPDEIARAYFQEPLPAFFRRTITVDPPPVKGSLDWVFTGPHAGFTVSLTASTVRVVQRYYNSIGLADAGSYPNRTTLEDTKTFTGAPKTVTVILDSHLALQVLVNGQLIITQRCLFDVTRHQLMLSAPRTQHEVVAGSLLREAASPVTISVDVTSKHQTMRGFGGSPSIPAYASLSDEGKRLYWDLLKRYNLLIDREYPMGSQLKPDLSNLDKLSDATPHYYGDNFPNGEVSDFDYSRHTLALGGSVIYEMWALPTWATVEWHPAPGNPPIIDAWKKQIDTAAKVDEYARIVVTYCRMLQQRTGAAPAIVGIQNEVEQPPEVFAQMTTTLRRELDHAGFNATRIHMADAPYVYMAVDRINALKAYPEAWRATGFTASHQYDYQKFLAEPDSYDESLRALHAASLAKPFLATEICLNDPHAQEPSYRIAFAMGQLYHKDLTLLDAEMLLYCWLILDVEEPTFGSSRSLLVPDRTHNNTPVASSFQLRVLGAFSRHIATGMTRIDAHTADPDVLASAFVQSEAATLVVINRSTEARQLQIDWHNAPAWKQVERTSLYLENQTFPPVKSGEPLLLAPGEILTLSTEIKP